MATKFWSLAIALSLLVIQPVGAQDCPVPLQLGYEVVSTRVRSAPGFTEGLVYRDGSLWESVGGYGSSGLNRIDLSTGKVSQVLASPKKVFAEGLMLAGDQFYQLTWKEHLLMRYSLKTQEVSFVAFPYLGWGFTQAQDLLGKIWVISEGSERLRFFRSLPIHGRAWNSEKTLRVTRLSAPEVGLNSLAFAAPWIYANVFPKHEIDQINLNTGCVQGVLDLEGLERDSAVNPNRDAESVLNGIAYRPDTQTFYVTGKNWPKIYEIRIK